MASETLALSNPELLAEYVRQSELKSFFEKRLAAPPDHMAMLIRDGQIIDTFHGAHFSVGGVFSKLKSLVTGSHHISILLADLKPFSLQTEFAAITKDNVPVACVASFELQINPERSENVMGLVNSCRYLTREEVLNRFKPHLTDRVVENAIGRVNADELRGERGLQDHLQAEIMREVERIAGDLGLLVRAVSVEWALNDVERQAIEQAALDREQTRLDHQIELLKNEIQRNQDAKSFQLQSDVDFAKLQNSKEEELQQMVLDSEVRLIDARVETERRQELETLGHEIEVLRKERAGRFENHLAEADHELDLEQRRLRLQQVRIEIDALEQQHMHEMKKSAAFTDLEIHERKQFLELTIAERAQQQQFDYIRKLQTLDLESERAQSEIRNNDKRVDASIHLEQTKAENDGRVAELSAASSLSPEQILATKAGLSPEVANVFAEQARASASGNEQVMAIMREMVAQANASRVSSETQALEMFRAGMDGAKGVAAGAGGKASVSVTENEESATTVTCPACRAENSIDSRFCLNCGHQLRT